MKNYAIVFPGQGAQSVGMGKDSAETNQAIASTYKKADEIFSKQPSISEVSFNGPEETLTRTLYTQPAILTLSIALASQIKEAIKQGKLSQPNYVAGHSLGEFSALYMADVLSLEDVLKLVIKRAELMENAPSGAMTAMVGMEETQVNEIIREVEDASVANYNAPDQIVATGTKAGMEALAEAVNKYAEANAIRVKVIPLNVGGAFHSPLMQAASEEFSKAIDACSFNNASIPVIQNISGMPVTNAQELKTNLKKQMTGSVQWTDTVRFLLDPNQGAISEVLEVGPGKVLAGLVKKQDRRFPVTNISSVSDIANLLNPAMSS